MTAAATAAGAHAGPVVAADRVTFRLDDPGRRFRAVSLRQELRRPRTGPPLAWDPRRRRWYGALIRPAVDRMEYRFEGRDHRGQVEVFCDPRNPLRVPGPSGERSVVEFPGYRPPAWLDGRRLGGDVLDSSVPSRALGADVHVRLWSSRNAGVEEPRPLLVVHDGSDYERYADLLLLLDRLTADGPLPPARVALLDPVARDEDYSASAAYARALSTEVLPALSWLAPTPPDRPAAVGLGSSLGALALLHAQTLRPGTFAGQFLQAGSYFRQRFDRHEAGFPRFRRITRFVGGLLAADATSSPVPVTMTCGAVEDNLPNNRAVVRALRRQGHPVRLVENPDAHNPTGWRDTFDPHLVDLLRAVWTAP